MVNLSSIKRLSLNETTRDYNLQCIHVVTSLSNNHLDPFMLAFSSLVFSFENMNQAYGIRMHHQIYLLEL